MSFYTTVLDNLYDATHEVLTSLGYENVNVIFSGNNTTEPEKTYCLINVLNFSQVGFKDEATFLTDYDPQTQLGILETVSHYKLSIQYSFIGNSADVVAMDFRHNLINNQVCISIFNKYNWGFLDRSDIRRSPQPRDAKWVEMFNMDMRLSFAIKTRQQMDWVETTSVVLNYSNNNTTTINNPITIPSP
jgi:hypothetical protein